MQGATFQADHVSGGQGESAGNGGDGGQAGVGGSGGVIERGGAGGSAGDNSTQAAGGAGGAGGESGAAVGGAIYNDAGTLSVSATRFAEDEASSVIGGIGGAGGAAGFGFVPPDGALGGGAPLYREENAEKQGEGGGGGNASNGAEGGQGGDGGSAGETLGGAIASSAAFTIEGRTVTLGREAEAAFGSQLSQDTVSPGQAPSGCPEDRTEPNIVMGCPGLGGYASEEPAEGGDGGEGDPPGAKGLPGDRGQEGAAGRPGLAGVEEGPAVYIA